MLQKFDKYVEEKLSGLTFSQVKQELSYGVDVFKFNIYMEYVLRHQDQFSLSVLQTAFQYNPMYVKKKKDNEQQKNMLLFQKYPALSRIRFSDYVDIKHLENLQLPVYIYNIGYNMKLYDQITQYYDANIQGQEALMDDKNYELYKIDPRNVQSNIPDFRILGKNNSNTQCYVCLDYGDYFEKQYLLSNNPIQIQSLQDNKIQVQNPLTNINTYDYQHAVQIFGKPYKTNTKYQMVINKKQFDEQLQKAPESKLKNIIKIQAQTGTTEELNQLINVLNIYQ